MKVFLILLGLAVIAGIVLVIKNKSAAPALVPAPALVLADKPVVAYTKPVIPMQPLSPYVAAPVDPQINNYFTHYQS